MEDRFEIWGSMTTGMAYDLTPFVREEKDVKSRPRLKRPLLRLITTGLLDPGICHWGERVCRYLKHRFDRPVIDEREDLIDTLRTRLRTVRSEDSRRGLVDSRGGIFGSRGCLCRSGLDLHDRSSS